MADDKRYHSILKRMQQRNEDAPWIYTDEWCDMFMEELDTAFEIQDLEWIQELEDFLK